MPSDGSQLRFLINAKTSHFVKDHKRLFQQNSLSNSLGVSHTNNLKKKMLNKCTKTGLCFRYRFTLYIDECRTTNDLHTRD
jgi:hypothetical protein